ncbi:ABC transporter ATP-binding protein [Petrotoga olearia]|uniref:Glycine/betaine ABC transporter ATPase n=2 Tax=Petrotoga olearia TaxID=156203 RepID=A0A2K1P0W1_9BACT|nr:ABC transporter ATP-binding protein [Petrotoga olearia]KUK16356.1 MAG: Glycine betaine/L-proline ABC transporter, ATPase subunit [Petrotoga mobilis]PNR96419.1 glycine/betaine ABC transporter ATPase [Petrotoga olearia DSM 13574]RMA76513.1 osmoprotectant transport system ATP-binding protein [Petrotoga olearia]
MAIKLVNLTKKYGDFTAVNNLNIEFEDNKLTVLIGPSGCGKTTTLKMINRLIERTSGDILFNGKSIDDINPIELRRSIGYVIQEIGLFPHMTVFDNIAVVPRLLKWPEDKIKKRVYDLLDLVNLDPESTAHKYPAQLSGGQRQRVGVARGLAADPDILLMDEPFGAIDPINRETLQDAFIEIQEKIKKTIIFVTHDIREAIKLGDKIAIFKDGELVQYDDTQNIVQNPKDDFVKDILGEDSQFKALEFVKVSEGLYKDMQAFKIDEDLSNIKSTIQSNYPITIFVDKNNNYKGFIETKRLNRIDDSSKLRSSLKKDYVTAKSSLYEALNKILSSSSTNIPVVTDKQKVIGVINLKAIFEQMSNKAEV